MLPVLMLIGVGKERRIWLPLPFFLLWPFWLLAWIVWLIMSAVGFPRAKMLRMALMMMANLSGLIIEVNSDDTESNIRLRMI